MQGPDTSGKNPIEEMGGRYIRASKLERVESNLGKSRKTGRAIEGARAVEALRKSEEQHRAIFEGAADGIVYADRKGRVIDVNPAFCVITGIPRDQVVGKTAFSLARRFAKTGDIPRLPKTVRQALSGESVELYELEINNRIVEISTPFLKSEESGITGIVRDITERKKAQRILEDNEEEYRGIFENTVDVYYRADFQGNLLLFSPSGLRLLGYDSVEDLTGKKRVKDFYYNPKDREILLQELAKCGRVINYEVTLRRKDGTPVFVETNSHFVYNQTGKPVAVEGIFRDISDRKRAEEALRESEKRFRDIFENTLIGMYQTTPDGQIRMANSALVRMLGYASFEELAQRNLEQEGFEPDYPRSQFKQRIEADGRIIGMESAWRKRDGTTLFVRESAQVVCDKAGNTIYYQGTVEDITDRKKAELAAKESEKNYRDLVETSLDMIFRLDLNGGFTFTNHAWSACTGYSAEEAREINGFELIHPEDLEHMRQRFANVIAGNIEWNVEFRSKAKSGEYRDILINGSPVFGADGKVIGVLGAGVDITERKKAETELREYQAKLKAMAAEILRTQERERQRLAVGLHDDICQKLVLSKFTLESSLRSVSDAKLAGSLKMTAETIGETIRLAESLTFELSNPVLREFGFVSALEKYLASEIKDKHGIAFELKVDESFGTLKEDIKTCLFRAVRELLANVVKHAKAQKVKVSVRKSEDMTYLTVQDDGVGFDPATIKGGDSRFIRFGLFSIREQLEQLGGVLAIESKPGQGTMAMVVI